ncbi:hypothetical protein JP0059_07470 [Helicobacter pylori]|nr:hypothetical protein JP0059_07470 [Helicobacter pylori]
MENKNTQADKSSSLERNELHNTIWKVANELRGSVDGWDFKQYVWHSFLPLHFRKHDSLHQ